MYRYTIIEPASGHEVYINLITSLAGQYISRRPYLLGILKEVLSEKDLKGPVVTIERDMGRIIGNTDIVETSEKDTIYYAQPNKINIFARYAKNRYPSPSKKLTIILELDSKGDYEITNTWIGPYSPPFPGDEKETAASKAYWETHALAQDAHSVQTKSITRNCPY